MEGKVTKEDFVEYLRNALSSRNLAEIAVDTFVRKLEYCLFLGRTVELRGFGTFEPVVRKGKAGRRNPKTGEPVEKKKDRVTVKFKVSKTLEKEMNRDERTHRVED